MQKKRKTRKQKQEDPTLDPTYKNANDKFGIDYWQLNKEQRDLRSLILTKDLVFVDSKAGVGKSSAILYTFVEEYLKDKNKKIIIIRTPVEAGLDKIGFLPAELSAKVEPHFQAFRDILNNLLNKGKVECDLEKRIQFMIPNFALGRTFDDSLIVISEAQQIPPMIMKLLLERIGENSVCVVEGDSTQLYVKDSRRQGLSDAINIFFDENKCLRREEWEDSIAYYEFSNNINMRSDIVKIVNEAYEGVNQDE